MIKSFPQWLHGILADNDPILENATVLQILEHLSYNEPNEFNIRKEQIKEHLQQNDYGRLEDLWKRFREEYVPRSIESEFSPDSDR